MPALQRITGRTGRHDLLACGCWPLGTVGVAHSRDRESKHDMVCCTMYALRGSKQALDIRSGQGLRPGHVFFFKACVCAWD